MNYLFFDFETHDPYMNKPLELGAGYTFGINNPDSEFEVLGVGYWYKGNFKYVTEYSQFWNDILEADIIIAHNMDYDLGCLHYIQKKYNLQGSIRTKPIICTLVMARMADPNGQSFSLNNLSKHYLGDVKDNQGLEEVVAKHGLVPLSKVEEKAKLKAEAAGTPYIRKSVSTSRVISSTKNLLKKISEISPDTVAKYCLQDVALTKDLFFVLLNLVPLKLALKFSFVVHVTVDYRIRGIRVDLQKAETAKSEFKIRIKLLESKLKELAGTEDINLNSVKQVAAVLQSRGLKLKTTDKGALACTKKWLESQTDEFCKLLIEYRLLTKYLNDFIEKVIKMQPHSCPNHGRYGRVFPSYSVLGAAATGRFTSSNPNIQQIPKPKEDADDPFHVSNICRSIYVPEEGETWYSLDFAAQEIRMQVHFAEVYGCEGGTAVGDIVRDNPNVDFHQQVAEMANITRKQAKILNLGVSYGMGKSKIQGNLGVSEEEAIQIRNNFDTLCPYLKSLNEHCKRAVNMSGYVVTIGGRKLPVEIDDVSGLPKVYQALNRIIQGSSADQTMAAMVILYLMGINVINTVHDELNISAPCPEIAEQVREVMENAVELTVPSVAEISYGKSWGDC
jgi:DNA polymerase I-like protein with 3'-5' exonuclease and polymerase domains